MIEVIFLLVLAFIWVIFATISDIRTHEVPNWLNFSIIIFALGFRFFYSFFSGDGSGFWVAAVLGIAGSFLAINFFSSSFRSRLDEITNFVIASLFFAAVIWFYTSNPAFFGAGEFTFFYQGLLGLGLLFIVGNLLNYGKAFAAGDAKLMVALGTVLPIFSVYVQNFEFLFVFIFLFLLSGSIYGIFMSVYISLKNPKRFGKGFRLLFKKHAKVALFFDLAGVILMIIGLADPVFMFLGIFAFVFPYMYLFFASVDESCMVKKVPVSKLTPGDWLYEDVKVGRKLIRANWDGVSEEEIVLLKPKKEVLIRQGIAFVPVFLISLILLTLSYISGSFQFFSKLLGF